ncbi:hypothetical protein HQ325_06680 [Rhodococcus sp. BP-349]|uniref:type IV toxin-antitoxin system AbiEi family antitoxin n=1 Tax=unclassified Rhodococcus (in: high G+C Gram-positive bacteria) TaxID=192944 RepID=UPI001C9AAE41|nr:MULTISPECIES: hypothetical protein [unclassified Rhodococcus (in: high G+C Gram-positive bacteria)]MBY6538352.1 hypothetical protein [Rhodococcus sp. BP-363]MBY6542689.1 hypothetical protein [Rhodococcus sp. BP-369]MBY6561919.1 hypothetical protein [Rhodococcus sp. BP-370]MBY6576211.1 hypothetical protein [Rhodococcus sp. BP-364]MBY6585512.1 hypothetical protein [Rhodococcus sp. BP-358]
MTLRDIDDHTDDELRGMVRRGELVRLGRGCYVDGDRWRAADVDERYLLRVRAALSRRSSIAVASHHSAAAVLGLATLHPDRSRVHVSVEGRGGGKSTSSCVEHRVSSTDADRTSVDGLRVTTPARTALDLSCVGSPVQALCAVESALRLGRTSRRRCPGWAAGTVSLAHARRYTWPAHSPRASASRGVGR